MTLYDEDGPDWRDLARLWAGTAALVLLAVLAHEIVPQETTSALEPTGHSTSSTPGLGNALAWVFFITTTCLSMICAGYSACETVKCAWENFDDNARALSVLAGGLVAIVSGAALAIGQLRAHSDQADTREQVQVEALRATDTGAEWLTASIAARASLCEEIEKRTGLSSAWLYEGLDEVFTGEPNFFLNSSIADMVGLLGAAAGH